MKITQKGCPGLHATFCGEPKAKGQGYCKPHMREYHRNRYKAIAEGQPVNTRDYLRAQEEKNRCPACEIVRPNLHVIDGFPELSPLCQQCITLLDTFRATLPSMANLVKLLEFLVQPHIKEVLLYQFNNDYSRAFEQEVLRRAENYQHEYGYTTVDQAIEDMGGWFKEMLERDIAAGRYAFIPSTGQIQKVYNTAKTKQEQKQKQAS